MGKMVNQVKTIVLICVGGTVGEDRNETQEARRQQHSSSHRLPPRPKVTSPLSISSLISFLSLTDEIFPQFPLSISYFLVSFCSTSPIFHANTNCAFWQMPHFFFDMLLYQISDRGLLLMFIDNVGIILISRFLFFFYPFFLRLLVYFYAMS